AASPRLPLRPAGPPPWRRLRPRAPVRGWRSLPLRLVYSARAPALLLARCGLLSGRLPVRLVPRGGSLVSRSTHRRTAVACALFWAAGALWSCEAPAPRPAAWVTIEAPPELRLAVREV